MFSELRDPVNLGKAVSGWYPAGDLVRVERVNSRARADYSSKFGPQSRMVMERSGRMASRYGELPPSAFTLVANGAIPPISPSTASAWRSLAVPTAWATCSSPQNYSPVLEVRHRPDAQYKYPIYAMPNCGGRCPSRAEIHRGAGQPGLELGYSKSLIDNFPDGRRVPASFPRR